MLFGATPLAGAPLASREATSVVVPVSIAGDLVGVALLTAAATEILSTGVAGDGATSGGVIEILSAGLVGIGTVSATSDAPVADVVVGGTGPGRGGYLHELRWRKKLREEMLAQERIDAAELAALNAAIAAGDAAHEADRLARIAARDEAKRDADAAREARIVARAAANAARDAEIEAERLLEEQRVAKQVQDDEDDIRLVYWLTAY